MQARPPCTHPHRGLFKTDISSTDISTAFSVTIPFEAHCVGFSPSPYSRHPAARNLLQPIMKFETRRDDDSVGTSFFCTSHSKVLTKRKNATVFNTCKEKTHFCVLKERLEGINVAKLSADFGLDFGVDGDLVERH